MNCPHQDTCGGCPLRHLDIKTYCQTKTNVLKSIFSHIQQDNIICKTPIFIEDGKRRRAEFNFIWKKGKLLLGFNTAKTHDIVDIDFCPALDASLNSVIPKIKIFLQDLCQIKTSKRIKNKIVTNNIQTGDIFLTSAENGIDILIKTDAELTLEQRMCISDFADEYSQIIRIAIKRRQSENSEVILEKNAPFITISSHKIRIPCGTFLQASKDGETALINTVLQYVGTTKGNVTDLFCGLGTFSYPFANNVNYRVVSIDSSGESLEYFQKNINALTIHNIVIKQRNLFKYPLDEDELKCTDILIFDPPRAGANAQMQKIAAMNFKDKPQKIVAVSCNPHTFINDANQLISAGYRIIEITPVDQFVYTNHLELVALFEKN